MAEFSAKDVQTLRQQTGAGMMDAKKALVETDGDYEAAVQWLREKGLAKSSERSDRDNSQGVVSVAVDANAGVIVQLRCETDFTAKSEGVTNVVSQFVDLVLADGPDALHKPEAVKLLEDLKLSTKENLDLGEVIRFDAADGNIVDSYEHLQDGRGVNAVLVELKGGSKELAHDLAVHIAFTKPPYQTRDQVPAEDIEKEREAALGVTRAEGKPEAAWDKIVDGRVNSWLKDRVLMDQKFVRDEKKTIAEVLGDAELVRFAQVLIG